MKKNSTLIDDRTPTPPGKSYFKLFNISVLSIILLITAVSSCRKDPFKGEVVGVCPLVVSTDPMDKAVDVDLNKVVSITFNTSMNATTINTSTVTLQQGGTIISGTVGPGANGALFTFTPAVPLLPFVTYTGTVTTSATDTLRTAMAANYVWSFTTIPQVFVSSNPVLGGVTTGAGTFAQGSVTTVSAKPNTGYTFTNWAVNGVVVSTSASYQFTMAGNKTLVANYTAIPVGNFAVNLSSNPVAGGTTGGGGSFTTGTTVTVTATPNNGYTFTNWTEGGSVVSTSSNYQFVLSANRTLVANFSIIPASQFAVVLSSNPVNGGANNGAGSYTAGTSVTVTATQNLGYTFTNWTEGGATVSTSPAYTFALTANRTLVANFAINTYTLSLSAPNGSVSASPSQANYNYLTAVQLIPTANVGFVFTGWSGDATGSANPLTVTMNTNKSITAIFTAITYTLNVTAVNGTVAKNPNLTVYNSGSAVVLTATPALGYTFASWSGDIISTVNPLSVTMNANKNITANFIITGPGDINLGAAAQYNLITKAGISTTGNTAIQGDIAVSPASATAITGFGLIMDASGQFSKTPIVTGKVYAADYGAPTPVNLTTAVNDMQTAYTTANNLVLPAPVVSLGAGNISGLTIPPGLYKWGTGVLITSQGVTLSGGPNDTWVFQIASDLTVNNGAIITLSGGAQAKHIYWVVAGQATLGTNVNFNGDILSKTLISINTNSTVTGKLEAQTAITLNADNIFFP